MSHFAIPEGTRSSAEAELASILEGEAPQTDHVSGTGALMFAVDDSVILVLIATITGLEDGRWTR